VLPQDMKKCQVYAGRKISFEPEEVTQMKAFDSSGLESFWISVLHLSEPFIICLFFWWWQFHGADFFLRTSQM